MIPWEDMVQAWKTSSVSDLLFLSTKNNLAPTVSSPVYFSGLDSSYV